MKDPVAILFERICGVYNDVEAVDVQFLKLHLLNNEYFIERGKFEVLGKLLKEYLTTPISKKPGKLVNYAKEFMDLKNFFSFCSLKVTGDCSIVRVGNNIFVVDVGENSKVFFEFVVLLAQLICGNKNLQPLRMNFFITHPHKDHFDGISSLITCMGKLEVVLKDMNTFVFIKNSLGVIYGNLGIIWNKSPIIESRLRFVNPLMWKGVDIWNISRISKASNQYLNSSSLLFVFSTNESFDKFMVLPGDRELSFLPTSLCNLGTKTMTESEFDTSGDWKKKVVMLQIPHHGSDDSNSRFVQEFPKLFPFCKSVIVTKNFAASPLTKSLGFLAKLEGVTVFSHYSKLELEILEVQEKAKQFKKDLTVLRNGSEKNWNSKGKETMENMKKFLEGKLKLPDTAKRDNIARKQEGGMKYIGKCRVWSSDSFNFVEDKKGVDFQQPSLKSPQIGASFERSQISDDILIQVCKHLEGLGFTDKEEVVAAYRYYGNVDDVAAHLMHQRSSEKN